MEERFAYGLNPKKLGALSSYLCDPTTAHAEFLLTKSQYQAETGRAVERGALFFQIRQAFPQGEVTPEEANKIGYETAMRWTKGKYQFFICTHIDKGHIHNHIYYNATACGGFLIGFVSSTIFPIFKIPRSTAKDGFCIMVNGSGKGPRPINSVCALP